MRGYKVYTKCGWGYEGSDTVYTNNYNVAVQEFNNLLRKTLRECGNDVVDVADFGDEITSIRESIEFDKTLGKEKTEIVCRKCPFVITKKGNKITAIVYYWESTSYEYKEYDISGEDIVLEEIEILE